MQSCDEIHTLRLHASRSEVWRLWVVVVEGGGGGGGVTKDLLPVPVKQPCWI